MIFFFASAGASAAYLTVSEIFPVEVRAKAIAVFFAIAQSFGAFGPWLYGHLIGNGQGPHQALHRLSHRARSIMVIGGMVEIFLGVAAEGKSLEDVATPLSAVRRIPGIRQRLRRTQTSDKRERQCVQGRHFVWTAGWLALSQRPRRPLARKCWTSHYLPPRLCGVSASTRTS